MKSIFKKLLFLTILLIQTLFLNAQYDHEFWFVAPSATQYHADGFCSRYVCTTTEFPAYVTMEMPKNGSFITRELYIPAGQTRYFWFLNLPDQDNMENPYSTTYDPLIGGKNNRGIRFRSRSIPRAADVNDVSVVNINIYYDYITGGGGAVTSTFPDGEPKTISTGAQNNPDLYSLLGNNALGSDFFTVFQTDVDNKELGNRTIDGATSSFDIVFTEDNTTIDITVPAGKYLYRPASQGGPFTNGTLTLGPFNRGESFKGVPAIHYTPNEPYLSNEIFGRSKDDRLTGVRIKARNNKKIAVTLFDDSMYSAGCYNLGGDQTIPTSVIGKKYFAQPGNLTNGLENIYITATQPNTKLYKNTVSSGAVFLKTLAQGETYRLNITEATYIYSGDPVTKVGAFDFYTLQLTGTGCEMGMAVLPPIDTCTGSSEVAFTRPVSSPFHLLILCQTGAENGFTITGEGGASGGTIPGTAFQPIPGNTDWKYAKFNDIPENPDVTKPFYIKKDIPTRISNSIDVFHLGAINASGGGTRYGYFSNFNTIEVSSIVAESASGTIKLCYGQSAQIVSQGGFFYKWSPETFLSDPYSENPMAYPPPGNHLYKATIKGACQTDTFTSVNIIVAPKLDAELALDTTAGCDPIPVALRNTSKGLAQYWLDYGDGSAVFNRQYKVGGFLSNKTSIDTTITHSFLSTATTDTFSKYTVFLKVENAQRCRDSIKKTVTVFPKVTISGFSPVNSSGCDSLPITYTNTTTNVNAHTFKWDFGDNNSSNVQQPYHLFRNFTNATQVYNVKYTATSRFNCSATATTNVTVYPFISASFTVDTAQKCAPALMTIKNNSIGPGTYLWNFGLGPNSTATQPGSRLYPNTGATLQKYTIKLTMSNSGGGVCNRVDSQVVTVYPQVFANFTETSPPTCTPMEVKFTPSPANTDPSLVHLWEFGDGSTSNTANPTYSFVNYGNSPVPYTTKHTVISANYNCQANTSKIFTVEGRLDASFTLDKGQACADAVLSFTNSSQGGMAVYEWDFDGDGNPDSTLNSASIVPFKHVYNNNTTTTNTFNPSLTIRNSTLSCSDKFVSPTVKIFPKVSAAFAPNVFAGCNPLDVNFTRTAPTPATKYFNWSFGDGSSSFLSGVVPHQFKHLLPKDTTYSVRLVASSDEGCYDTAKVNITAYAYIKADFTNNKAGICSSEDITVINQSPDGVTHNRWDWGDNAFIPDMDRSSVTHAYDNSLTDNILSRTIKLTVKNDHLCSDSLKKTIDVYPAAKADFDVDKTEGCNPVTVAFTNNSNIPSTNFTWDFGDGASSGSQDISHIFTNIDAIDKPFTVKLTALTDYLCKAETTKVVTSYAFIKADFKLANASICPGTNLNITNASPAGVKSSFWDFDQNGIFALENAISFTHPYSNYNAIADTIQLKLKVQNTHACFDSLTREVIIFPKVTANFERDTVGCNPFSLTFKNNSVFPATNYSWDFKDGSSSKLKEPPHTFENKDDSTKTYFVKLTAYSNDHCSHDTVHAVKVYSYINADFKIEKSEICSDFPAVITDNSPKGVTSRKWDFNGDGIFEPQDTLSGKFNHIYYNNLQSVRVDSLSMLVSNGKCFDKVTTPIKIFPKVVANFIATPSSICNGEFIQFTNKTNAAAKSLNWEFGNGNTSNLENPKSNFTHTSSNDTSFNVKLTAVSPYLCKSDTTFKINVYSFINADFKVPEATACSGVPVSISDVSLGGITTRKWDYESDGIFDDINQPLAFSHIYDNFSAKKTNKRMKLVVENKWACKDSVYRDITIYPKVTAIFDRDSAGCHPFTSKFYNTSTNAVDYNWTFANEGTSALKNPSKLFNNYNSLDTSYKVTLVAISEYLCRDSVKKDVTVYHKPKARIGVDKSEACPPFLPVISNYSVTSKSTYYWNFGDGSSNVFTQQMPITHKYNIDPARTTNQQYSLKLKTVTDYGCNDSTSLVITVYPKVTAQFDSILPDCNPLSADLTNKSINGSDFYWDFDDGTSSNQRSLKHLFNNGSIDNRQFNVLLKAYSEKGCSDSIRKGILVYPAPVASFFAKPLVQFFPHDTFKIYDVTNHGPWKYSWDYGNGFKENKVQADSFEYAYPHWGKFKVKLVAQNIQNPICSDSAFQELTLFAPQPIAKFDSSTVGCTPVTIRFKNNSEYGEKYTWEFDDGTSSSKENPVHTFTDPGEYNVKLYVEAEGGQASHYEKITVYPKPIVSFNILPQTVMIPDDYIKCFNLTAQGDNYFWDFGDGETSSQATPIHYYKKLGNYTVKLTAYNNYGCSDSLERVEFVHVEAIGNLVFPNAFTPNMAGSGGGKYDLNSTDNNIFYPYHVGVAEYYLEIYNRWGELLFSSNDVEIGWDGYYKGKLVKQDVYVFKVRGKYYNGRTFVHAGDITVLHKDF